MRDSIKSEKYFDEFIAEDTARILKLTKKVNDGETGLNTGGMGTFSPSEIYTYELSKEIKENIHHIKELLVKLLII